jgi:hypothetical protein
MNEDLTGIDLKIERIRAGVQVKELAAAMSISPSRLSRIEAEPRVTDRMLARYRAALGTCRTPEKAA